MAEDTGLIDTEFSPASLGHKFVPSRLLIDPAAYKEATGGSSVAQLLLNLSQDIIQRVLGGKLVSNGLFLTSR